MSQGLDGVRKTAKERKQERFTALLHHLNVELLRGSFYALQRKASPGVDGVTWQEYESGLGGSTCRSAQPAFRNSRSGMRSCETVSSSRTTGCKEVIRFENVFNLSVKFSTGQKSASGKLEVHSELADSRRMPVGGPTPNEFRLKLALMGQCPISANISPGWLEVDLQQVMLDVRQVSKTGSLRVADQSPGTVPEDERLRSIMWPHAWQEALHHRPRFPIPPCEDRRPSAR
jgi:hypothetical protein